MRRVTEAGCLLRIAAAVGTAIGWFTRPLAGAAAALPILAAAPVPAQEKEQRNASTCAAIDDDAQRLACYDSLFRNPQAQFGAEDKVVPRDEILEIRGRVTQVARRSRGEYVLTLDNGQVWQQSEVKPLLDFKVGDEVLIRRGSIGSFRLQIAGRKTSTTVTRVR